MGKQPKPGSLHTKAGIEYRCLESLGSIRGIGRVGSVRSIEGLESGTEALSVVNQLTQVNCKVGDSKASASTHFDLVEGLHISIVFYL